MAQAPLEQVFVDMGPNPTASSSSSSSGIKTSPHPFMKFQEGAIVDVLDAHDLAAHLPPEKVTALRTSGAKLRSTDPEEARIESHVGNFVLTFNVSIQDLLDFDCKRSTVQEGFYHGLDGAERRNCIIHPFIDGFMYDTCVSKVEPPNLLTPLLDPRGETPHKKYVYPFAVTARLVENEFKGLLKDELKMGSTFNDRYLEVLYALNPRDPVAKHHGTNILRNVATFCTSTYILDTVNVQPKLDENEIDRMSTTAFLTDEIIERGVIKHQFKEDGPTYFYFPEEHGLSHCLKVAGPLLASSMRFYTLQIPKAPPYLEKGEVNPEVYIRVPEKTYGALLREFHEKELSDKLDRKLSFKNIAFWLGYKIPNEDWTDKTEKQRLLDLPLEERTKLRKISFKISVALLSAALPSVEDMFWSPRKVIGWYLPGIPFVDGCTPNPQKSEKPSSATEPATKMNHSYRDIKPRDLPHDLKAHFDTRKHFKTAPEHRADYVNVLTDV